LILKENSFGHLISGFGTQTQASGLTTFNRLYKYATIFFHSITILFYLR